MINNYIRGFKSPKYLGYIAFTGFPKCSSILYTYTSI